MKHVLSVHGTGLALGMLLGGWHALWSLLVAAQVAQPLIDLLFALHMIQVPVLILPFHFGLAMALIIVTGLAGYLFGSVFALVWNAIQVKK